MRDHGSGLHCAKPESFCRVLRFWFRVDHRMRHCLLPASIARGAVAADRRSRQAPTADRGVFSAREVTARGTGRGSGGQSRQAIPGGHPAGGGLGCLAPLAPFEFVTPYATPARVSSFNYLKLQELFYIRTC